jgi:hypothetical protein
MIIKNLKKVEENELSKKNYLNKNLKILNKD